MDAVERALGDQRGDRLAVGGAAVEAVREADRDARLGGGADRDPAEALVGDVVAYLEAERVAVEGQREVRVMDDDEALRKRELHAREGYVARAAWGLLGRVMTFATQPGTPTSSLWSRAR